MSDATSVPAELKLRNPLITSAGLAMLDRLREHSHAPRWNHVAGDRLIAADLEALAKFEQDLESAPRQISAELPEHIAERIRLLQQSVPAFRLRIPTIGELNQTWTQIATMSREDIATTPELFVPDEADLDDLIVYRTAGTTGHSLLVPHSARAAAAYLPMINRALKLHGITVEFSADIAGCFLVCAQARTVTFPTVLSAWGNTGFAKVNLQPGEWPGEQSPHRYFADLQPRLLTGDPISFAEMMRLGIEVRPQAMVSTAVALSPVLKAKLSSAYGCPVIEWYSLTETGPIGYGCPAGTNSYHVLSHDVFVECLDAAGNVQPVGDRGEITVSGGRNPYLPLLRYRTGDWGKLAFGRCVCGSDSPRIEELEGRAPVLFRSSSSSLVNPVDISRVLREFPLVQHEIVQRKDRTLEVVVRPIPNALLDEANLTEALRGLFGEGIAIVIQTDAKLGDRASGGKTVPFQSELLLEE